MNDKENKNLPSQEEEQDIKEISGADGADSGAASETPGREDPSLPGTPDAPHEPGITPDDREGEPSGADAAVGGGKSDSSDEGDEGDESNGSDESDESDGSDESDEGDSGAKTAEPVDLEHYSGYDKDLFEPGDPPENVIFSPNENYRPADRFAAPDPDMSFSELINKPLAPETEKKKKKVRYKEVRDKGGIVRSLSFTLAYIAGIIVVGVLLGMFLVSAVNDVFAFSKDDSIVEIRIDNADMSVSELAELFHKEGLIKYPQLFKLYINIKRHGEITIQTGTFKLSPSFNYDKMIGALNPIPPLTTVRITFPEGITTDGVIDLFLKNGIGTREGFEDAIENGEFDYWFLKGLETGKDRYYRLDGYLYPDTYEFYSTASEVSALNKMLKNFNKKFAESFKERVDELGLTVDQVIILASMIEAETNKDVDYEYVSAVFHNRLKSSDFSKFESDATVQYVLSHKTGERHEELTAEDLEIDSPYNTRKYEGFPPGPICNPALSAIKAAMYPDEDCGYFYFVAGIDGYNLYAKTLREHQNNIKQVEKDRAENGGTAG